MPEERSRRGRRSVQRRSEGVRSEFQRRATTVTEHLEAASQSLQYTMGDIEATYRSAVAGKMIDIIDAVSMVAEDAAYEWSKVENSRGWSDSERFAAYEGIMQSVEGAVAREAELMRLAQQSRVADEKDDLVFFAGSVSDELGGVLDKMRDTLDMFAENSMQSRFSRRSRFGKVDAVEDAMGLLTDAFEHRTVGNLGSANWTRIGNAENVLQVKDSISTFDERFLDFVNELADAYDIYNAYLNDDDMDYDIPDSVLIRESDGDTQGAIDEWYNHVFMVLEEEWDALRDMYYGDYENKRGKGMRSRFSRRSRFGKVKATDSNVAEALEIATSALETLHWGLDKGSIYNISEQSLERFNSYSPDLGTYNTQYEKIQDAVFGLVEYLDEAMSEYDSMDDDAFASDEEWQNYYDELLNPNREDFNSILVLYNTLIQKLGADRGEYGVPKARIRKSMHNRTSKAVQDENFYILASISKFWTTVNRLADEHDIPVDEVEVHPEVEDLLDEIETLAEDFDFEPIGELIEEAMSINSQDRLSEPEIGEALETIYRNWERTVNKRGSKRVERRQTSKATSGELRDFYYDLLPEIGVYCQGDEAFELMREVAYAVVRSGGISELADAVENFIESDCYDEITDSGIRRWFDEFVDRSF